MKFHLAINLERMSPDQDMQEIARHTLEADRADRAKVRKEEQIAKQ